MAQPARGAPTSSGATITAVGRSGRSTAARPGVAKAWGDRELTVGPDELEERAPDRCGHLLRQVKEQRHRSRRRYCSPSRGATPSGRLLEALSGSAHAGRRRGRNRAPTEVLADGCIGHRDPDFSAEHRRGSGGARCCQRHCFARRRSARERRSSAGLVRVLRFPGAAERGWSSASRARSRSVGRAILSESLRPALGDQLVDQFAIAGTVGERAAQLLDCGAPSCGRGVGRVRRPGHGLILAGGVAANRRFADAAGGDTPACPCLWLGREPASSASGLAVGGRSRPGKESVAKRSLACLTAMQQLGVLGGLLPVAQETANGPGHDRVRVPGENTILRDEQLRSFAPGARVVVIPQHVEKLAPGGLGGPLDVGCVDVDRVMIGTGPDRAVGHAGVGDRPVSRRGVGLSPVLCS